MSPEKTMLQIVRNDVSILVVIVLYRQSPGESVAWKSLERGLSLLPSSMGRLRVILFDNSPSPAEPSALPDYAVYRADPSNGGLAGAYNNALAMAETEHFDWLLTLDQDTVLPADYIPRLAARANALSDREDIAAIVPQLFERDILLSPRGVLPGRTHPVLQGFTGVWAKEIHAFNSGTLWRVADLSRLGGFSRHFRLDYLDIWMHFNFHRAGLRTFIAGDLRLEHTLSLLDYKQRVSTERYDGFLRAESAFCDLYKGLLERTLLTARLGCRLIRQRQRGERAEILRLTRRTLLQRLILRRNSRIGRWMADTRPGVVTSGSSRDARPIVSVCMATFEGSRFIEEQLRSILPQLRASDEVVIVDDGSTDDTCERIRSINDPRIHLIAERVNRGVLAAFERAICSAKGAVLFLSDQDDIWEPGKVETVLNAFDERPDIRIVVSDASIIGDHGEIVAESYYRWRGRFSDSFLSNLFRSKYHGCLMAFRASLLPDILPFPVGTGILHDIWIGSRNRLSGGRTAFLEKRLVRYRRHSTNVTNFDSRRRLSRFRQFKNRLDLLIAAVTLRSRVDLERKSSGERPW